MSLNVTVKHNFLKKGGSVEPSEPHWGRHATDIGERALTMQQVLPKKGMRLARCVSITVYFTNIYFRY